MSNRDYKGLLNGVSFLLQHARRQVAMSVNDILTATYWEIGRRIIEFEQRGESRAEYGTNLLQRLARDLTRKFGRGFGRSNLNLIRRFYLTYQERRPILQSPIGESPSSIGIRKGNSRRKGFLLSWMHYVKLLPLDGR